MFEKFTAHASMSIILFFTCIALIMKVFQFSEQNALFWKDCYAKGQTLCNCKSRLYHPHRTPTIDCYIFLFVLKTYGSDVMCSFICFEFNSSCEFVCYIFLLFLQKYFPLNNVSWQNKQISFEMCDKYTFSKYFHIIFSIYSKTWDFHCNLW